MGEGGVSYEARPLWPIEREVLEITASAYPARREAFREQMNSARVMSFENSGAGFFSYLSVSPESDPLGERSPLSGGYGEVLGVDNGMGFIVFLDDGRLSMIEGYCYDGASTTSIDFEHVNFRLNPWDQRAATSDKCRLNL